MRTFRIFLSSPGDVADERARARAVIERVGKEFAREARLVPVVWEEAPLRATASFQEGIDEQVDLNRIDLVVFLLWSRLGTPLGGRYRREGHDPTGTEWEFEQALAAHRQKRSPDLLVYRRTSEPVLPSIQRDPQGFEEATRQWRAVEGFIQRWFRGADGAFTAAFHTYGAPAGFEQNFEGHLRAHLSQRLARSDEGGPAWTGAPFRGLLAFDVEHAPIFFGRARATYEALRVLAGQAARGRAFLLILGASGAGKSSLARAGLLSRLTRPDQVEPGAAPGFVVRAVLCPGDGATPFESLVAALSHESALGAGAGGGAGRAERAQAFCESPIAAVAFVKERLAARAAGVQAAQHLDSPPVGRLLLLVDQLEELFTRVAAPESRRAFARTLEALATSGCVWLVATLRNDFYGRLAEVPELLALRGEAGQVDLLPPEASEVAEMVRLPAERTGLTYERREGSSEALDDALVTAALEAPGALPLLQFALAALYEARGDGTRLTWRAYEALGGLEGALTGRAEKTFSALNREAQAAFPRLVRSLVEVSARDDGAVARRKPLRADLERDAAVARLVESLLEARLLESDKDLEGRAVVGVAHEALLTAWGRFAGSVAADRDLLNLRRRLEGQAAYWEATQRDPSALLSEGLPLEDGERLLRAEFLDLDKPAVAFVNASLEAARERAEAARRTARRARRRKVGGLVALLLAGAGTWGGLAWARQRRLDLHLVAAREHLGGGRLGEAREALAAAKAERAEAPEVALLAADLSAAEQAAERRRREGEAREQAAAARGAAKDKEAEVRRLRDEHGRLSLEVEQERATVFAAYAPLERRAEHQQKQRRLAEVAALLTRTVGEAREALEAAARAEAPFGGTSTLTKAAFGEHFMERWREALARHDDISAALAREQVERVAREAHCEELDGLSTLRVTVDPPDAEVYLFRYEPYETVRRDRPVLSRLVPVPTTRVGRLRPGEWVPGFFPGDRCLLVTAVEPGSPAAGALAPGDLVLRINDLPCGEGLFVTALDPSGAAARAGVQPFDRLQSIDGQAVEVEADWTQVEPAKEAGAQPYALRLLRAGRALSVEGPREQVLSEATGLTGWQEAPALLKSTPAPEGGYQLLCLRRGEPFTLTVPAGKTSGLSLQRTAYPLILGRDLGHRLAAPDQVHDCAPGSYLLYVRAPGREDQRYPVLVERGKGHPAEVSVRLLPEGTSPEGFVYVPPGVFLYGGDPEAVQSAPAKRIEMAQDPGLKDGFWIARHEVTWAQWLEFLNDPETQAGLVPGRNEYLPRQTNRALVRAGDDGRFVQDVGTPSTAVLGVSWNDLKDVRGYLAWKNRKAQQDRNRWRYDLPSDWEYERAARGADGRLLPWGQAFDFALCPSKFVKPYGAYLLTPGAVPEDESPFGVLDLAGGRYEWSRSKFQSGVAAYVLRGGSWGNPSPTEFRSTARSGFDPLHVTTGLGARLVAHPGP